MAIKGVAADARRQKVQSAEVGLEVLKALAGASAGASLSELADAAGMPASKAHRYLKALIASGFAEQEAGTGRYGLGPEALHLGLAAIGRIDVARAAAPTLAVLNAALNHSCFLAVWGNRGPVVVQVLEAARMVTVMTRVGSVMPILTSATGLTFRAYLPPAQTEGFVADEIALGAPPDAVAAADTRVAAIRALGLCIVRSLYHPGVDAIAAPVFGASGTIAAVITTLGPTTSLDTDPDGSAAQAVRAAAAAIGARIGFRAP